MKRLTERDKDGLHKERIKGTGNRCCDEVCESVDYCADCPIDKAFQRLADIEDILGDDYSLDWLKEVVEADKEYKTTILHCDIGDTIWSVTSLNGTREEPEPYTVGGIHCGTFGWDFSAVNGDGDFQVFPEDRYGVEWFTSKEEAEKALKKIKEL